MDSLRPILSVGTTTYELRESEGNEPEIELVSKTRQFIARTHRYRPIKNVGGRRSMGGRLLTWKQDVWT